MRDKKFKLSAEQIQELAPGYGGCMASDMITVDGNKVGFMYREEPNYAEDSGWCFMAGNETQEYMDDPENLGVYDVNTIANYDKDIIPLLDSPVDSSFERDRSGNFTRVGFTPPEE